MDIKRWIAIIFLLGAVVVLLYSGEILFPPHLKPQAVTSKTPRPKEINLRETMFYEKLADQTVRCGICFRRCLIPEGKRGFCRNRENLKGILYNIVYGRPSAIEVDPIEKEPQCHFLPGSEILCFGTAGCNFRCKHCQNWQLSQCPIEEMHAYNLSPEQAIRIAQEKKIPTISFTYNEPTSFYEYVYDIARLAKEKGIRVIWHSNGTMAAEPLKELLKYTDGVTIDLKGFTEKFYREVSAAELEPVLKTLKIIKEQGVWLEIVNLIIPGLNDDPKDIQRMCQWIKQNLGADTPLHFSRFFPAYKLTNLSPTPVETLEKAYQIASKEGLHYVTIGNVPGHKYNSTFCPKCQQRLIHRLHFTVLSNDIVDGKCKFCGYKIAGVWE